MVRVTSPLQLSNFRWFFAGRVVSLMGSSMAPVALTFAVLDHPDGSGDLGIVLAANMVPLVAFMLLGGAISDRHPRRTVLLVANVGAGLTQGAVAAVLLTGNYHLLAVAALEFANGALAAFTRPALRGILPELVPGTGLQRANALLATSRNATKIAGPTIAALLVTGFGGGWAIAADAISYLLAAVLLARVTSAGRTPAERSTVVADLREGWRAFRQVRWIWVLTVAACLLNLVYVGPRQVLGPELTRQAHGPALWGLILSCYGVGMLVMSVLAYRLVLPRLLATGQLVGLLAALPLIALGLAAPPPVLLVAGLLGGVGTSLSAISWETSLQEHVRPEVLSRVSSYDELLSYLAIPIGQLLVGPVADAYGAQQVTLVAGLLFLVFAALPLASSSVRRLPHVTSERTVPRKTN